MLRQQLSRIGGLALVVAVVGLACLTSSCGGGGGAKDMVLVEFLFVDRSLVPTAPTGTENLPRNAQILLVFSELVDPASVNDQTVRVRFGPTQQSVPKGSFSVDGNTVRFDPTVTAQGQPNPFGFEPVTQYIVDIPSYEEQPGVVRNLDDDPNLVTFLTSFTTSSGFLRELVPPEVLQVTSIPDRWELYPLTGDWPGNGIMAIEFSEPMDPSSFIQAPPAGAIDSTTIDVRYTDNLSINPPDVNARKISGTFTGDASATIYFFRPTFSWGAGKYEFGVELFQGLKDLSGNLLVNPRGFGRYICDGMGIQDGAELSENFINQDNLDDSLDGSDALVEWGDPDEGILRGAPIESQTYGILGYTFQGGGPSDYGQYAAIISPFVGNDLNNPALGLNLSPPTSAGRRVMQSFADTEIPASGPITAAFWGPDSNATFASNYPTVILRCGFKKTPSLSLAQTFSGNYEGQPTVLYKGTYQVPQQANVGNTVDSGGDPGGYGQNPGCQNPVPPNTTWNQPLWDYTGFQAWPDFTAFFEWSVGDPAVENDSAFLWDVSMEESETAWQQVRGWFASTFPCSGILIAGFPNRRMYSTYEDDEPNPLSNFTAGILNPEPSVVDTAFTVTKRVTVAQCLFYTPTSTLVGTTFGDDSDYLPAQLTPSVQSGGAEVRILFQGAGAVEADRETINLSLPFTDWTENIDDCDGFACIRWKIELISNLISNQRAELFNVNLPVVDMDTTN